MAYSTMRFIFDDSYVVYQRERLSITEKLKKDIVDDTNFFVDDLYAGNDFFKLFSQYIISFDEFGNLHNTAYVKKTHQEQYPFYIGFHPLTFFIRYVFPKLSEEEERLSVEELLKKALYVFYQNELETYEIDEIYSYFLDSYKNKKWNFKAWAYWCDILLKNYSFLVFVTRVFVHEFFHILFHHLDENVYDLKKFTNFELLNIAEDFVINSSINWSKYQNTSPYYTQDCVSWSVIPLYFAENSYMKTNYKFIFLLIKAYIKHLLEKKRTNVGISNKMEHFYNHINKMNVEELEYNDVQNILISVKKLYPHFSKELGLEDFTVNSTDFYYHILAQLDEYKEGNGFNFILLDSHNHHRNEEKSNSRTSLNSENNNQQQQTLPDNISRIVDGIVNDILEKIKDKGTKIPIQQQRILQEISKIRDCSLYNSLIAQNFLFNQWKKKLEKFIGFNKNYNTKNIDISFKKENRRIEDLYIRYEPKDYYDFIIVVDISPSIRDEEYMSFVKEIQEIGRRFDIDKARVIYFSSTILLDKIVALKKITSATPPKTQSSTNLQYVFDALKEQNNKKPVVVFTDGYFEYFNPELYAFRHLLFVPYIKGSERNFHYVINMLKLHKFDVISNIVL